MLALGNSAVNGPVVQLEEDATTLAHLFHFMQDNIDKHPNTATMAAEELVKLYAATIKYQAFMSESSIEQSIR